VTSDALVNIPGFAVLEYLATTENIQIRECFGMRPEMTGVLVSRINPQCQT
jgi:hypothetical protein